MRLAVRGRGAHRWITFGAIAFGALFLVVGVILAGVSVSFLADAERARGTVVALEWRNDHNGVSGAMPAPSLEAHADEGGQLSEQVDFTVLSPRRPGGAA